MRSAFTQHRTTTLKAVAVILLITVATLSYGRTSTGFFRVFWNKFTATVKSNGTVELNWEVTEYNNRSFHIQHSTDGQKWESIDTVASKRSMESIEFYSYTHRNKTNGKHYYRVKDIDIDGKLIGFSEIIIINIDAEHSGLAVWPNPATTHVRITGPVGSNEFYTRARIYDLSGKIVADKTLQSQNEPISVNELRPGIYFLRADSKNGTVHTQKIVKQ